MNAIEARNLGKCYRKRGSAQPTLLDALRGRMPDQPARETFSVYNIVVTNDARVYCVTRHWPSMQTLNIDVEHAKLRLIDRTSAYRLRTFNLKNSITFLYTIHQGEMG